MQPQQTPVSPFKAIERSTVLSIGQTLRGLTTSTPVPEPADIELPSQSTIQVGTVVLSVQKSTLSPGSAEPLSGNIEQK